MLRKSYGVATRVKRVMLTEDFSITTIPDPEAEERMRLEAEERRLEEERQQEKEAAIENAVQEALEAQDSEYHDRIDKAKRDSYEEGRKTGYTEGELHGVESLNPLRKRFMQLLLSAGKEKERIYTDAHGTLLNLLFQIAEKIIRREIENDRDIIVGIVQEALSFVADTSHVKVRLHPDDLKESEKILTDEMRQMEFKTGLDLEPDDTLELGDCIIETNAGEVDARLRTKLQELEQLLSKSE